MPGFAINNTDGARSKNHKAEFRRKHRWRVVDLEGAIVSTGDFLYLQKANRPNFKVTPAEVHHDQEVAYFAGKQEWDPLVLEFYDAAFQGSDISEAMYGWVTDCTQIESATVQFPGTYKRRLSIVMTDGQGSAEEGLGGERWNLYGCWVTESNWNDLDYSNSEVQLVTVTIKYDRAERQ